MTHYLPDVFEAGEASSEAWALDNIRGDDAKCAHCGAVVKIATMLPATPSPYALPICRRCSGEEIREVPR